MTHGKRGSDDRLGALRSVRRSPSGRTPKWVLDEAAGRATAPPPWRAPPSTASSRGGGSNTARERLWTVLTIVVVVGALAGLVLKTDLWQQTVTSAAAGPRRVGPPPGYEEGKKPGPRPEVATAAASPGLFGYTAVQPDGRTPVTYSPCRPIHYVVRQAGAPANGTALIDQAVARVSAATGLRFINDGPTNEPIIQDRAPYQPNRYGDRWAPVLVAWATSSEVPDFGIDILGEAGSQRLARPGGQFTYVTGTVALDSTKMQQFIDRFGPNSARSVIEHELGHLVGLAHVSNVSQIMFPRAQPAVTEFGSGDLAGLAHAGSGDCVPDL